MNFQENINLVKKQEYPYIINTFELNIAENLIDIFSENKTEFFQSLSRIRETQEVILGKKFDPIKVLDNPALKTNYIQFWAKGANLFSGEIDNSLGPIKSSLLVVENCLINYCHKFEDYPELYATN